MKELSLNILDIAQNSVKAKADTVTIELTQTENTLKIVISDNGCGMTKQFLESVTDPFTTTRTTRKVGLGIPLFKLAAEQTGGELSIESYSDTENEYRHGTVISALFYTDSIDFTPLGDIESTLVTLIQGQPGIHWVFSHVTPRGQVKLDTALLRDVLGDVPLDNFEVICWITEYLKEQYEQIGYNENNI